MREVGVFKDANLGFHNPSPPTIAIPASGVSSIENPSSKTYSDEDRSEQVAVNKPPQLQPPPQQKSSSADAVPNPELLVSRPIYHQERVPTMATGANPNPDPKREVPVSGYALQTMPPTEQQFRQPPAHTHQLQQQQQQQQQPQFIATNPNPQYIQHPATGTVLPFQAYYQMPIQHSQQSNPYDPQQLPVYYLPFRQTAPSPYNMPIATSLGDVASQGKQVPPSGPNLYRMAAVQQSGTAMSAAVPPLIHMAPEQGHPYTGMGYHVVHHHHPSQAPPCISHSSCSNLWL
ncbi:hypothetical protein HPP92_011543 [Vanilla planifolia]|uniref:Uncharacterized protein n=1 Tax=Vanilla planifolia TaxID=51239 RepID=A0A835V145_VANPL|nr:hypothetical protein HPP92_011543 [Vanilla planifolia]